MLAVFGSRRPIATATCEDPADETPITTVKETEAMLSAIWLPERIFSPKSPIQSVTAWKAETSSSACSPMGAPISPMARTATQVGSRAKSAPCPVPR